MISINQVIDIFVIIYRHLFNIMIFEYTLILFNENQNIEIIIHFILKINNYEYVDNLINRNH
jgi:hypothetical protein